MRKKFTLLLASLFLVMGSAWAENVLFNASSTTALPGNLADGQYAWKSSEITAPTDFNTLRLTFIKNTNESGGVDTGGFPHVALAEFYLYDKGGNVVKLTKDQFSSNATETNEGESGIHKLCDGFTTKQDDEGQYDWYWHSYWSADAGAFHYLEINVSDVEADLTTFAVGYVTRQQNASPFEVLVTTGSSTENVATQYNSYMIFGQYDLSNQAFRIKNANVTEKNLYLTIETPKSNDQNEGGVKILEKAIGNDAQAFKFISNGAKYQIKSEDGYYLNTLSSWGFNAVEDPATENRSDFELQHIGNGEFRIKGLKGYVGPNNSYKTDHPYELFSNHSNEKQYIDWILEPYTKTAVKVYTPGNRVTTLENGKKYFIYNTTFNGATSRTGFISNAGTELGHSGSSIKPANFKTTEEGYIWTVEVVNADNGEYYLKASNGKYASAKTKSTTNTTGQLIYIQDFATSTCTIDATAMTSCSSENSDGTKTTWKDLAAGSGVFTISGTKSGNTGNDCWNGNAGSFALWSNAHPYAFYEVAEDAVMLSEAFPLPGKTYYIYCDNDARQYFYNDGGTLKVSEKRVEWSNDYLFTCSFDGTYFQFKNAKGKYLKHQGLQDAAHNFELAEFLDGVNLKTPGLGSGYFVMKNDNTFSQASKGDYNPASTDYSTVYKFEEFNFPVDGETYYIYSDTYYNNEYVNRYMYADGSSLKLNTSLSVTDAYKWTCKVTDDGYVQFQNGAGKYLAHKGIQDTPYNFTLNKYNANHAIAATLFSSAGGGRYFVVKSDGTAFDQSSIVESGDYCADFVFMPVSDVKVLSVNPDCKVKATATWNNVTKALPATWVITPHTTIANKTLSISSDVNFNFDGLYENGSSLGETIDIDGLEQNCIITAKFSPAFFSKSTDEEDLIPVRIRNVRNNDYTIRLNNASNNDYTAKNINSGVTAYGENEIWYLVGTEENFKIYNRIAGTNLHVVLGGINEGNAAAMNTAEDNANFCLQPNDERGYFISPVGNKNQSLNMHGGVGNDIKLYDTTDDGSDWIIEKMDVDHTLTFCVSVEGETWKENRGKGGVIKFTVDGINSSAKEVTSIQGEQVCYFPLNSLFSIASDTYRGYTFSFNVNGEKKETMIDQTLSESLTVMAQYTANEEKVLFHTPRDGHPYRIPAIATAPNGDIFAICDYRPCNNDIGYGEVDIVCRISNDNGVTWGEELVLADGDGGTTNRMETGYGDPAIVADRESNKLLVMMVAGRTVCHYGSWNLEKKGNPDAEAVNRVARIYLTYNETTGEWDKSEITEMTDHMYSIFLKEGTATVPSMFIGSGKICQSRVVKKDEYYRLYCSVWTNNDGNRVIYSDDFGGSWNVLGTVDDRPGPGGDEPKVEELPDGTVVLSSRVGGGRIFNLFTFNNDGEYTTGSWGTAVQSNKIDNGLSFGGNSTNGEIYKVKAIHKETGRICNLMLQSVPTGSGRSDVAVFYKELDADTYIPTTIAQGWTKGKHVSYKSSCYSTMILQADGRIAFFFEEAPGSYSMVYIPYTVEDLTANQYSLYTVESTIGQYGVGTFYASEAMQIPAGVKAYVADKNNIEDGIITMTRLEGIIPAHTGAVLRGEAANYNFIPSISYGTPVVNNMLVGYEADNTAADIKSAVALPTDGSTNYVLTVDKNKENPGFYKKTAGFNVYNNKAYLNVPAAETPANALRISFAGEENDEEGNGTTGVDLSTLNSQPSTEVYDLQGRRVLNPTKGMYIVNGRKVVIK